jgi:hypothetical protein
MISNNLPGIRQELEMMERYCQTPMYEVEMYGTLFYWPDDWAIDKSIRLFDCTFTRLKRDDQGMNISVKSELEAENESEAKEVGSHACRIESQIFAFSSDTLLILDSTVRVKEKASDKMTGSLKCYFHAVLAPLPVTLTMIQLESALSKVHGTLDKENPDSIDLLKRAMNWYTLGKMEKENNTDRFIKFWIALEVLTSNDNGKTVIRRVKNALIKVYPEIEAKILQDGVIGDKMFNLRGKIFHEGKLSSGDLKDSKLNVATQLRQTEDILTDLLRFKLGLPSKALSREYFS